MERQMAYAINTSSVAALIALPMTNDSGQYRKSTMCEPCGT